MASRGMEGSSVATNRVKAGTGYYKKLTSRDGEEGEKGVRRILLLLVVICATSLQMIVMKLRNCITTVCAPF